MAGHVAWPFHASRRMAALKPFVHTLPLAPACALIARGSLHATHPPFASTRLVGYGYVSATSRLPPTCERIRHHLHVDGRAYELLAGLSLTLFRCAHVRSRTAAQHRLMFRRSRLAPSCGSRGLLKNEAGRATGHLRAMPTSALLFKVYYSKRVPRGIAITLTGLWSQSNSKLAGLARPKKIID